MARHNELGKKGEEEAQQFLRRLGFSILEQNWRFNKGEIDIIAQKENLLVFVEVKTRSSIVFGLPQDFVKHSQVKKVIEVANAYVDQMDWQGEIRLDIIAIHQNKEEINIEHLEDAFYFF